MSSEAVMGKGGIVVAVTSFITSFFVVETLQILALIVTIAAGTMSFITQYRRNKRTK